MKNIITWLMLIVASCALLYGMYWLAKTCSYFFFYEDMVQGTIREMVKPEYLFENR